MAVPFAVLAKRAAKQAAKAAARRSSPSWGRYVAVAVVAMLMLVGSMLGVGLTLAGGMITSLGGALEAAAAGTSCGSDTAEPVAGMNEAQQANARAILAAAQQRSLPEQAIVIAFMTAIVETEMHNYAASGNGQDDSQNYPNDGVRPADAQSVGLMQQQPWWGTMAQRMSPVDSAGLFFDALVKVPSWTSKPLGDAAQEVQRSAFPDRYAAQEARARSWYSSLIGSAAGAGCGPAAYTAMQCTLRPDLPASLETGLTPDAIRVAQCGGTQFPDVKTILGVGSRPAGTSDDHASGRALDFMITDYKNPSQVAFGDSVAEWFKANAASLGVKYVIWNARIWSVERNGEGWRPYNDPTGEQSDNTMHRNHVHVSVYGGAAVFPSTATGEWTVPIPVAYKVGCGVGCYAGHKGQDIEIPTGTPIVSIAAGTVRVAAATCSASGGCGSTYGSYVVVDHGGGIVSIYAHNSQLIVATGATVKAGQLLAYSGATGNVTGPHLHFEIRTGATATAWGTPTDPIPWMEAHGASLACAPQASGGYCSTR